MEDVLEVYTRHYNPRYPRSRMDEISKQRWRGTCEPLPAQRRTERHDHERLSGATRSTGGLRPMMPGSSSGDSIRHFRKTKRYSLTAVPEAVTISIPPPPPSSIVS